MTKLEQILGAREWKGAEVKRVEVDGRPAFLIRHPSGATAQVWADAAGVEVRHWAAWTAIEALRGPAERHGGSYRRDFDKAVAHYEALSGARHPSRDQRFTPRITYLKGAQP